VKQNFLAGETAAIAVVNAYFTSKETSNAAAYGGRQYNKDPNPSSSKGVGSGFREDEKLPRFI
jgi:hypothetical protein